MTYGEWRQQPQPAVLTPQDGLQVVNVRASCDQAHPTVVDLFRPGREALVVCLRCGESWEEGAESTGVACQ